MKSKRQKEGREVIMIGVAGPSGVGKDTMAEYLYRYLHERGLRVAISKFAEPVKEAFSIIYSPIFPGGYEESQAFKHKKLPNGMRVRDALVNIGMSARAFDDDVWVRKLTEDLQPNTIHIITDIRFPNEAQFIKRKKSNVRLPVWCEKSHGFIVELGRNGVVYEGTESETRLPGDLIDYLYRNVKMEEYDESVCADLLNEMRRLGFLKDKFSRNAASSNIQP